MTKTPNSYVEFGILMWSGKVMHAKFNSGGHLKGPTRKNHWLFYFLKCKKTKKICTVSFRVHISSLLANLTLLFSTVQGRRKVWKSGGGSDVLGIICPPAFNRVNWSAKMWGVDRPLSPDFYGPALQFTHHHTILRFHLQSFFF